MHDRDHFTGAGCGLVLLATLLLASNPASAQILSPDVLQFSAATYTTAEGAITAAVTVTRTGNERQAVSVLLYTGSGTAVAGQDFTPVSTTVNFPGGPFGVNRQTIQIPIRNDAAWESSETLTVNLALPTGGAQLGTITSAAITIADDDPPATAPSLTVGSSPYPKQFQLSWPSVTGATFYRLWRRTNPFDPQFTLVATYPSQTTSTTLEVAVHRFNWAGTRYIIGACNPYGCASSGEASAAAEMLGAIGYFKASNTEPAVVRPLGSDEFGTAVALSADGHTLAVGAPIEDSDATGVGGDQNNDNAGASGAVYVFTRAAGGEWTQQAYLKTSNIDSTLDFFGSSLALSGDGNVLAVGTQRVNAVYVFTRSNGQWTGPTAVEPVSADAGDGFGLSLAISRDGTRLAVGAPGEDSASQGRQGHYWDNSARSSGAAYVFQWSGTEWQQEAYIKASNAEAGDEFGHAVALSPDGATLAVGAPLEDSDATTIGGNESRNAALESGAVYVFAHTGVRWEQQAYVKASNAGTGDRFGTSIALGRLGGPETNGSRLAVGAPREDSAATGVDGNQSDDSACDSGAAYTFERDGIQWSQQSYVKASNTEVCIPEARPRAWFGSAIALSANGSTLAVGAIGEGGTSSGVNGDQTNNAPWPPYEYRPGAVFVFDYGSQGISGQRAYVKASNPEVGDRFSDALALSSNGDTLAVGAEQEASNARGVDGDESNNDTRHAGAVYLY